MRLVCPNCDAQYEVDDGVIPEDGRDVQCSNCGHTWFQPGADAAEPADEAEAAPEAAPEDVVEAEAEPEAPAEAPVPVTETAAEQGQRRALDQAVLDVLREEAEHERRARAAERSDYTFESQPNLGLEEVAGGAGAMRERMARLRGVEADEAVARLEEATPRRELLPDVEEINSTLRATSERTEDAEIVLPDGAEQDGGFKRGFVTVLAIFALAAAVYLYSARIAAMVPAAEPALATYARAVDAGMAKLNATVSGLVQSITGSNEG